MIRSMGPLFGAGIIAAAQLACGAADASSGIEYTPAAAVARLPSGTTARDVSLVLDFDVRGDTLYLIEVGDRVRMLVRSGSSWNVAGEIGRAGDGPGEFRRVSGIAITPDGFATVEPARTQYFTRDGAFVRLVPYSLPCSVNRPSIALSPTGVYLTGNCHRVGYVTDSVYATLFHASDSATFSVLLEDLRYTRDGEFGSIFGPGNAVSAGSGARHLFGAASINCRWEVVEGSQPRQLCPAAMQLYRADAPDAVRQRTRRPVAGMKVEWPETLPVFMAQLATSLGDILVRPWSADSVVLQLADGGADIAVAPFEGFVGCKAGGCLWVLEHGDDSALVLLDTLQIRSLIQRSVH